MVEIVEKRDGRIVKFDKEKIIEAISKAYISIDESLSAQAKEVAKQIAESIAQTNYPLLSVEEIQDKVEQGLMGTTRKDVAKKYILYRDKRTKAREKNSKLTKEITSKLFAKDIENQNANVDEASFGGRMGAVTSAVTKNYALNYCMSEKSKNNHLNNEIYIHDLDHYAVGDHNCLSIPFDKLLAKGFNTRQTDVRPAQSVNTAFQLVAVIFQLQSLQQFGGVSATHLDWTMVPYVRKSFLKHFIAAWLKDSNEFLGLNLLEMLFDDYTEEIEGHIVTRNKFEDWVDLHKGEFFKATDTKEEDYRLDNKSLPLKHYQSALYDTIVEVKQAVEGMYHNLNTLQSRSGNQLN